MEEPKGREELKNIKQIYNEIHENKCRILWILSWIKENNIDFDIYLKHCLMKMCNDYDYILDRIDFKKNYKSE